MSPSCLCAPFHALCSPETCELAPRPSQPPSASSPPYSTETPPRSPTRHHTLRAFRLSASGSGFPYNKSPCVSCGAIVAALTQVEDVKSTIQASIEDVLRRGGEQPTQGAWEDWEEVLVELMVPQLSLVGATESSRTVEVGKDVASEEILEIDSVDDGRDGLDGNADAEVLPAAQKVLAQTLDTGRRIIRTCATKDNSENWRHFNIWRDASDGWETQGCQAIPPLTCHPVRRTDEDEATRQLKAWMGTCDRVHGCVSSHGSLAPTRLVKISDNQVRVVETLGEMCKYSTLSHRWGHNERFTLVKSNAEEMAHDIPWDTIPRTYRDAIEVTRKLGVDYIWIDTMCIVQDDSEDWRRESTRMKSVYGGSYLNIAAVSSAGSRGGLFASSTLADEFETHVVPEEETAPAGDTTSKQGTLRIRQQPHFTHVSFGNNYRGCSPLLSRGWVLQERILAPRIVYFDQEELKWECYGGVECLCGGMLVISNFNMGYRESLGMRKAGGGRKAVRDAAEEKPLSIQWMRIAERYSESALTFDSDRMIALAGIAEQALRTRQGGRYLAGLWEQDLAHQICWEILDTHRRPTMYIAPSWSWLSVLGSLDYSNRMDYQRWASVIDVEITQAECTLADETRETGPVIGGFIKVNGRVVRMDARLTDPGSENQPQVFALTHGNNGTTLDYGTVVDYVMTSAAASNLDRVLLLYWGEMWPYRKTFLALKAVVDNQDVDKYERLGIVWYEHDSEQEEFERILSWCQWREDIVIV